MNVVMEEDLVDATRELAVSVIIPTYHDWPRLQLCLKALADQNVPLGQFDIIVVNNDPDDPPPQNFWLPENARMIVEAKAGSYAARNAGLRVAIGQVVAFTDSDCIPRKDWIGNALKKIQQGADRIAGHVEMFFDGPKPTITALYEKTVAFDQEFAAKTGTSVTANMFAKRATFKAVGMFNEAMLSGGDTEWGWRAKARGLDILYSRDVVVFHPARSDWNMILRKKKRIAGGALMLGGSSTSRGLWPRLLLTGFFPPLRELRRIWLTTRLNNKEKMLLSGFAYCLKLYYTAVKIGLIFGLVEPERR